MPYGPFQKVRDLVGHYVGQDIRYLFGTTREVFNPVDQYYDFGSLIRSCECQCARVLSGRRSGDEIECDWLRLTRSRAPGGTREVPLDRNPGSCQHPRSLYFRTEDDHSGQCIPWADTKLDLFGGRGSCRDNCQESSYQ